MFINKLFFTSLFIAGFVGINTAKTEEIDTNLLADRKVNNQSNNSASNQDEIVGVPFEEEIKKIEKTEEVSALNEQQVQRISKKLDNNYGDNFRDKINIDNHLRRSRGTYKLNIKVKDPKDSKLGSTTMSMKEAYNCFMNKDYELAIYHYRNALAENGSNAEAAFGLGASYQMLLQYDQAIEMYLKLIKNSYNRKKAVSNLLIALHHKTDKQALEILQNIDDNTPGYADIVSQIGVIHLQNQDYSSALSALSKANDIAPDNALIAYNLGIVYDKLKNKDYAKHFYEQALRNDIADIISAEDANNLYKRVQQLNSEIMDDLKKS